VVKELCPFIRLGDCQGVQQEDDGCGSRSQVVDLVSLGACEQPVILLMQGAGEQQFAFQTFDQVAG
jgi:hypothetical protein